MTGNEFLNITNNENFTAAERLKEFNKDNNQNFYGITDYYCFLTTEYEKEKKC